MSTFTVGVFQNADWARRGVAALVAGGFVPGALTLLSMDSAEAADLIAQQLGGTVDRLELKALGATVARGPLVAALQGSDQGLSRSGLAASIHRAGFQPHDGYIFETLVGRGGVLIAVEDEPRAADALATLHAYGAGNAAIGAWAGRL